MLDDPGDGDEVQDLAVIHHMAICQIHLHQFRASVSANACEL